jgi:hypothetical protein
MSILTLQPKESAILGAQNLPSVPNIRILSFPPKVSEVSIVLEVCGTPIVDVITAKGVVAIAQPLSPDWRICGESPVRRLEARIVACVRLVGTEPMKRLTPLLLLSASVAVGCTQLQDSRLEARQRRMARAAYTTSPGACNGTVHSVDYRHGFEEGYYDVASGGDGCPPALPPKKYWSATYHSPAGQEHVKAWFQGYRDGAAAAKADGASAYGTLYISEEHRNGMKRAAQPTPAQVAPLAPQPTTVPLPPSPSQVPILGPAVPPLVPPNSTQGVPLKPPMSDAQKAPTLRDLKPPVPIPPSSAQRPDLKPLAPMTGETNAKPIPALVMPEPIPAAIPAVKQVGASVPTPAPEPVKLKLPEFELPEGFAPEATLGEPQAVGSR